MLTKISFQESYIAEKEFEAKNGLKTDQTSIKPSLVGILSMTFLIAIIVQVNTVTGTLGTILLTEEYALSESDAMLYCSIVISTAGVASVAIMLIITRLLRNKMDERKILIFFGLIPIALGLAADIPVGSTPMPVHNCTSINTTLTENGVYQIKNLFASVRTQNLRESTFPGNYISQNFVESLQNNSSCSGCPVLEQPWCAYTPQISPYQLIIAHVFYVAPTMVAVCVGVAIYTKILGPSKLGVWMSLPSVASCAAKIGGTLWVMQVRYSFYSIKTGYSLIDVEFC